MPPFMPGRKVPIFYQDLYFLGGDFSCYAKASVQAERVVEPVISSLSIFKKLKSLLRFLKSLFFFFLNSHLISSFSLKSI